MDSQDGYTVRLLIFSGRPDPEWTLDGQARDELSGRVRETLGAEESNPPPPAGLGYRGFLVKSRPQAQPRLPQFTVFRGVLTVDSGLRTAHWRDVAGVEDLLLTQARERGYGEALDLFGAGAKGKGGQPSTQQ